MNEWRDYVWESVLADVDIEQLADCLDDKWRGRHYDSAHAVVDDHLSHMQPGELMKYIKECR